MSARRKLTDAQIAFARAAMAKRRELLRQLRLIPTLGQLADEFECSKRWLEEIARGVGRKCGDTSVTPNIVS